MRAIVLFVAMVCGCALPVKAYAQQQALEPNDKLESLFPGTGKGGNQDVLAICATYFSSGARYNGMMEVRGSQGDFILDITVTYGGCKAEGLNENGQPRVRITIESWERPGFATERNRPVVFRLVNANTLQWLAAEDETRMRQRTIRLRADGSYEEQREYRTYSGKPTMFKRR